MVIDEVICEHGHRRSDLRVWSWRTDTGLTRNERDASNASRSFIPVENARTGLLGDVPMHVPGLRQISVDTVHPISGQGQPHTLCITRLCDDLARAVNETISIRVARVLGKESN
jgi:hypothetical protein